MYGFLDRPLPPSLEGLREYAQDVRWNWSHSSDRLWQRLDPETFELTNNPQLVLSEVSQTRLEEVARDPELLAQLQFELKQRQVYLNDPGWFRQTHPESALSTIAYFSMEFGLSESLPIYSGGLGILAGDYLKTASDLGFPVVGIGLLYQQGYFRQILSPDGKQLEAFPYNDPMDLPVTAVRNSDGGWLRIRLELPGRDLMLRVWQVNVGKVPLYLLDSNDPTNTPWDRAITSNLYAPGNERRFLQEVALGVGGWRVLEELGLNVDICHLNEGHAAFAILARARGFMNQSQCTLQEALWATRAGNVFTTHTAVAAAFDHFEPSLIEQFAAPIVQRMGMSMRDFLALGRRNPDDADEPFHMGYLALRGSAFVNGVSRLHGRVSRQNFQPLFPQWPEVEVPITHITNGVHVPSWDSESADRLWTDSCGDARWYGAADTLGGRFREVSDEALWGLRTAARQNLIGYVGRRIARQRQHHGASPGDVQLLEQLLRPDVLTLGFARRFTAYKRPNLILSDTDRLERILCDSDRPVQLIVAGKAHPADDEGKRLVQLMAQFASRESVKDRVVFLEDYDMALSKRLTAGIDVWLNTPRRPWEACGTSGMKVLVNGGINLSELDGWWAEAYAPEVGWALGDGREHADSRWDMAEADELYHLLETEIVPQFYDRDESGIPVAWVERIRASMSQLTPRFSCNRMLCDYLERAYLPSSAAYRERIADKGRLARELSRWSESVEKNWSRVKLLQCNVTNASDAWQFDVLADLGPLDPAAIRVELYAESLVAGGLPVRIEMNPASPRANGDGVYRFVAKAPAGRPAEHYTPRVTAWHPDAILPGESALIRWRS